jgi:hypothetical protein
MNRNTLRGALVCAALSVAAVYSSSARADEGQPTPNVGTCGSSPGAGEVYLYYHDNFGGTCYRLSLPSGESFAQIRNVSEIGVPNDQITSAKVGPGTALDMWEHHYWNQFQAGAFAPMWNDGAAFDRDQDSNFGLSPDITGFNDLLTSLRITLL